MPSIIVKNISIILINILFNRISYLRIFKMSWKAVWEIRYEIFYSRQQYYSELEQRISILNLIRKTKFFLVFDIYRFFDQIILKKKSAIETY